MTNDTREALADELDGIASLLGRNQLMQRGTASRKIRQAAAALRTPVSAASSPSADRPVVSIKKMRKSGDDADYFVSIKVGDREVTPHVFTEEYKAAYHVALYDWLLTGGEKPDLMAFGPNDWPARIVPSDTPSVARPDYCATADSICHHPACTCVGNDSDPTHGEHEPVAGTEREKIELLRKYCSAAAADYAGLLATMEQEIPSSLQSFFQRTAAELKETSEFMRLAAEGRENGLLYDDELTKTKRELRELKNSRTVAEIDEALIERMARAAWERTHDGQFDDRNCCDEFVRQSYIEDMRAALAASPAAPSPAVERENKLHDLLNDAEKHVSELIDQLRSAEGALKAARAKISDERPTISNANVWQSWREMNASLIAIREILDAALTAQPATAGEP